MYEFGWLPGQWAGLDADEKALVIAGIDNRLTEEARERKRAEREARS